MSSTKTNKGWELAEDDPLWFLKHNPRAYSEVKKWLQNKKAGPFRSYEEAFPKVALLDELLGDLEKDM